MRKTLSIILFIVMLIQTAQVGVFAAEDDAPLSAYGDNIQFDVDIAAPTMETVKTHLESDQNVKIKLMSDVAARIGKKGDKNAAFVECWCTLGQGVKVIDLNGYNLTLYNDEERKTGEGAMTMFKIPSGAELVINDSKNYGEIAYGSNLSAGRYYCDERNIIEITGGKLTVNGGKLTAGRTNGKTSVGIGVEDAYRQTHGCAVTLRSGEAVFNGGVMNGRGLRWSNYSSYYKDSGYIRNCAIRAFAGKITINDGEFWGRGNADVMQINNDVDIKISNGYFNTDKCNGTISLSMDSYWYGHRSWVNVKSSKGNIGIPVRESSRDYNYIKYLLGNSEMTQEERAQGGADQTSTRVSVIPRSISTYGVYYRRATDSSVIDYTDMDELKFSWDKKASLSLGIISKPYFPAVRDFDIVGTHTYPENTITISETPGGSGVNSTLTDYTLGSKNYLTSDGYFSEWDMIDLSSIPTEALNDLKTGRTYYVRLTAYERWKNQTTVTRSITAAVPIKITITDVTPIPDYDIGFTYENDSAGRMRITGTKDGETKFLRSQKERNIIDSFTGKFTYTNASGGTSYSTFSYGNFAQMEAANTNFRHGASNVTYTLTSTKDGKSKTATYTGEVVHFPIITASPAISSGSVLVDATASNKTVTLYSNANNTSGIFWAKDGNKISGSSGKSSWPVSLTSSSAVGLYSVGYTVDGNDVIGNQSVYLGIKDGTRTATLSTTSSNCTISDNSSTTPTISIKSMTGLGEFDYCKWHLVSWPDGYKGVLNKQLYSKSASFDEILGWTNNKISIIEGEYQISCTVYDTYKNNATTSPISIYVKRPPSGMKLYTDSDGGSVDVTDSFIVLYNDSGDEPVNIYPVYTPENSHDDDVGYESNDESIAQTDEYGNVYGTGAGSTKINAYSNNASASVTALVPKTKYDITVPQSWLTVKAGEKVKRGNINISASEDFTCELSWEFQREGSSYGYEYTDEYFVGNLKYRPVLKIYPKEGVCYPVVADYFQYSAPVFNIAMDRFEITVNGETYYSGIYCSRERNGFYDTAPVSTGDKSDDYITLDMDQTDLIIDWKDEYLNRVIFTIDEPKAGQSKDTMPDDVTAQLGYNILTDGITFGGDNVWHITDISTIKDDDYSNDSREDDFETYEVGETYRYDVWLLADDKYTNSLGGKVYFANDVTATDPDHSTLTDKTYINSNMIRAICYFTISEDILIGDVNMDECITDADAKLYLKYLSGIYSFNAEQLKRADVNFDEYYNMLDVIEMLNIIDSKK